MDVVRNSKPKEKTSKEKESDIPQDGKIDVAKKYNLSGPILSQKQIDEIVNRYKKNK